MASITINLPTLNTVTNIFSWFTTLSPEVKAKLLTLWESFKMDFKERFLNFETAKGIYLAPAGLITIFISIYYQQYVIQGLGIIFGWYLFSEGLRKVIVNRFAQNRAQEALNAQREALAQKQAASTTVDPNAGTNADLLKADAPAT